MVDLTTVRHANPKRTKFRKRELFGLEPFDTTKETVHLILQPGIDPLIE